MKLSRRGLIALGAAGLAAAALPLAWLMPRLRERRTPDARTVAALVDRMVPADEHPGALALGVDRALLKRAGWHTTFRAYLNRFCDLLDAAAEELRDRPFADLPDAERDAVLQRIWASREEHADTVFTVRGQIMRAYYSLPATWAALGYRGPPQPLGYHDYREGPGA